jgi:hypothetical protein
MQNLQKNRSVNSSNSAFSAGGYTGEFQAWRKGKHYFLKERYGGMEKARAATRRICRTCR